MAVSLPTPNFLESVSSNGRYLYEYNGNLYWCCLAELGDAPYASHALQVWKSADSGATWTRIINDTGKAGYFMGVCLSAAGILHFVVQPYPVPGNLALYRLDLNPGTPSFLTDDTGGPSGYAAGTIMCAAYTSGRILISYRKTGTGWVFLSWNAGTWSSSTTISALSIDADWMLKEST